ncbi:sensory box protein [Burkholderia ambifaria AMMD]|uniref:histidine kinase n=1 Tax=Burkholderia ambifaria (strain ATCC BAA-244 / DSM 16087 / CCUG 44356 / LMG 19182 / AMMD) TaxID=339670 RepID=Q0B3T4_BURCM|nr:ATP-binding protein [Burkholderia ambifaria]ABI91189.1 PAS/PAC sensor hybrid histidine kinase [Burkholderia ambifaria AMMD]AJY26243.1 sensory box protein [Burkholderia ambifaria AMMD]MBR7933763.1 PAS domain-containing protein [Burkholderia ambifaria]PEH69990.1 hybrid sensor histidine kinase/response regulator [Burkholderia ambifaria]QQC08847.1 PAS domain-containing protein [Burkholderia ambifaria]
MSEIARPQAGNYATAVMLVATATVLQTLAIRFGGVNLPLILYYPLLAGAAWATSFLFGILSTVLSGLLVWTLFLSDASAYTGPLPDRLVRLGIFMLVGVLVCAIAARLRHARVTNRLAYQNEAAARRQLDAVLQALPDGVIATDAQGRITYVNAAAIALAGGALEDATGRPVRDVLHVFDRDDRPVQPTPLERALAGAHALSDRHWLHGADGSPPVPIVEAASPIVDAHGSLDGAVLLLRDAGTERALAEVSRLQRAVVDASPDAIVGIDREGRIVSWNPAAQRIFGYDEADARGRPLETLVAMRWLRRNPLADSFDAMREAVGPLELLCVRRDGRRFRATVSAGPVRGDARNCVALSLTLRETGAQRRRDLRTQRSLQGARDARDRADTSNRLKDELLATVSHELRTPLNVIYGWIEVLRNTRDDALEQQAIDAIDRSARSLTRMVGDILDASSLATGKLRIDPMPVDVVRLFSDTVGAFQTAASSAGIVLEFECAASACVVSGDAERLRQMLANLVSNALKFTPGGGAVTVTLSRDDAHAVLVVADTGQGIPPAFIPHVFDMFRRADDSPASPRRGLGLGLSIVRHIAGLHGGQVRVESAGRNRGATFTVTLPAGWQPTGAMAWGIAQADGRRDRLMLDAQRILIVDDDATTRASLTAALTTLGAAVSIASSGREALAVVANIQPTVVLSDLAMPDGDGFWLLDALRHGHAHGATPRDLRVLAVTAHAGPADERRALEAGFDGFLCKPVDVRELAHKIADVTQRER